MGKLLKNQIFNVYTISTVALVPVVMMVFWISQTELVTSWNLIYETSNGPITYVDFLRKICLVNFVSYGGFDGIELITPFLAAFSAGFFFRIRKGMFTNAMFRSENCAKFIWKKILITLFISMVAFYVGYLLFVLYGVCTHTIQADETTNIHNLFRIFGENFWIEHPVIYLLLEGIFRFALFPFTYAFFAVALSFYTSKPYIYMVAPGVYFYAASIIFGINGIGRKMVLFRLISPTFGVHWEMWPGMVPFYIPLISFLPIWIFSFIMIQFWIKKGRLWE